MMASVPFMDVRNIVIIRAFNVKIWPIFLTILSTILGLVPFFFDGPSEVFWFAFAIGTVSGLVFSILALVFVLQVFAINATAAH